MVSAVNTGVPLPGGTVNSPGQEQQSANTFFDIHSTEAISHPFDVHESPVLISAYDLDTESGLIMVLKCTMTPNGEIMNILYLNGRGVGLVATNNTLLIDLPGRYRLQCINAGALGSFTVVGQLTALSYWSWGLVAYANAIDQSGNSQNPVIPP